MRASAILVLAACGSSPAVEDAASDMPGDAEADHPIGTIRVTAIAGTRTSPSPLEGATVLFTDVDQTQVVTTDSAGRASATVHGPTSVTTLEFRGPTIIMAKSVLDAQPGDDIMLAPRHDDLTEIAPLTVTFTQSAPVEVCGPCECVLASSSPVSVPMRAMCKANVVEVLLLSVAQGMYATASGPYDSATGGVIAMPPQLAQAPRLTGTFTNVGPPITSVVLDYSAGYRDRAQLQQSGSTLSGQVYAWPYRGPRLISTFLDGFGDGEYQVAVEDVTPAMTGLTIDTSTSLLTWIRAPRLNTTTMTIHVPIAHPGADGDLFAMDLSYNGVGGSAVTWQLFQARPGDVVLPPIPPGIADMTPTGSNETIRADVVASAAVAGYSEARKDPYALWYAIRVPGSGSLRFSTSPKGPP